MACALAYGCGLLLVSSSGRRLCWVFRYEYRSHKLLPKVVQLGGISVRGCGEGGSEDGAGVRGEGGAPVGAVRHGEYAQVRDGGSVLRCVWPRSVCCNVHGMATGCGTVDPGLDWYFSVHYR